MNEDKEAFAFAMFFISYLFIGLYLIFKDMMTADVALCMWFIFIGICIMWFWGVDEIRSRMALYKRSTRP